MTTLSARLLSHAAVHESSAANFDNWHVRDKEQQFAADLRAAAALIQAAEWRPIETAPKDGRKVILSYINRNDKSRTVMAKWLTDEQAAETDADDVGLEGGWYECIDNWDYYTEVAIHEGEPTHWLPLPTAPTGDKA